MVDVLASLRSILNPNQIIGQSTPDNPNLVPQTTAYSPDTWDNLFGWKDQASGISHNGVAGTALDAASALMNGYLGMQNYGLAKDQFNFQKDAFNKNWAAQSKLTNASLSDRQAARVASNPTAYQSVSDYMKANGV